MRNLECRIRYKVSSAITAIIVVSAAVCVFLGSCKNSSEHKKQLPDSVTYATHIAQIIYSNCTPCHRPNGGAPFDFITYTDLKKRAKLVALVTESRFMPPWPADAHYTSFKDQRVLSEYEISLIQKWVKSGCPQGDSLNIPAPPIFSKGSLFGKPDLVLKLKKPYLIKGNNKDYFTIAKVPISLPRDTFIAAVEFVPGKHRVVHHMNGYLLNFNPAKKAKVDEGEESVDYEEHNNIEAFKKLKVLHDDGTYPMLSPSVSDYLPGVVPTQYPAEIGGYRLSRKAALMFNMHYGPRATDTPDDSYFNVFFRSTPPKRPIQELMLGTNGASKIVPPLVIEPKAIQTHHMQYTLPSDIAVITINPHMHLLGKSFLAYAIKPNGDTIRLIRIPKWDFRWQYFYTFKKMLKIPAGSTIYVEGIYDNTINNPNNPFNPPKVVAEKNGSMRTTDEMFQFIINYVPYKEGDERISLETKSK